MHTPGPRCLFKPQTTHGDLSILSTCSRPLCRRHFCLHRSDTFHLPLYGPGQPSRLGERGAVFWPGRASITHSTPAGSLLRRFSVQKRHHRLDKNVENTLEKIKIEKKNKKKRYVNIQSVVRADR